MSTVGVFLASLVTISFGNSPDSSQSSLIYYDSNQNSTILVAAIDEPVPPDEMDEMDETIAKDDQYGVLKGDSYYLSKGVDSKCRQPGFYAGAELSFLKPYVARACVDPPCTPQNALEAPSELAPNFDYYGAPRLWLGYTSCTGFGCRVRWWQFDQTMADNADFTDESDRRYVGSVGASLDVNVLDFEVTDSVYIGPKWDLMVSGGVRYAKFFWTQGSDGIVYQDGRDPIDIVFSRTDGFEGTGATTALQLRRNCHRHIGVFANVRGSLLYGDETLTSERISSYPPANLPRQAGKALGVVRSIWEAQLGVDWTYEICDGLYFTSRVAGEVQYWDSMVESSTDTGFAGVTLAAGFIR